MRCLPSQALVHMPLGCGWAALGIERMFELSWPIRLLLRRTHLPKGKDFQDYGGAFWAGKRVAKARPRSPSAFGRPL